MEIKGTRTEELLKKTFSAELGVSFRYMRIAEAARRENLNYAADLFEATAQNELDHASHEFNFLGGMGDVRDLIKEAIQHENNEATEDYPEAARVAEEEGFREIAQIFQRIGTVEARHEEHFRRLQEEMESGQQPSGQTVGHSAVEMAQVMLPEQANPAGFVHGGELMKFMDNAAGVVATRHTGTNIVTANVENIQFLNPVRIGDLLIARGKLTFASHSSMEVVIEVEAERIFSEHTRNRILVLSALFIMVAVDSEGKALPVPPLIWSTEEEEKRFEEGRARYENRLKLPNRRTENRDKGLQ
jgi:acyl-CoA hydrolase